MAKLLFFLIVTSTLIFADFAKKEVHKPLHGGWAKAIAKKVQEQLAAIAGELKNVNVTSSRDKLELYVMANEYSGKMQMAIYTFNQGVPHMKNEVYRKKLTEFAANSGETIYEIQKGLYGDADKLKGKFIHSIEQYGSFINDYCKIMSEHYKNGGTFINNKIRAASDMVAWAVFKLHLQAHFFAKSTKELGKEIDAGLVFMQKSLDKLSHDDDATKSQLFNLIKHLTQLTQEAILKLESWLNINSKDDPFYAIVQDVAEVLSHLLDKLHNLAISGQSAPNLVKQLKEIHHAGTIKIKTMTEGAVETIEGEQDYVRNVAYDCLAVGHAFAANLEIFLSKKDVHDFE